VVVKRLDISTVSRIDTKEYLKNKLSRSVEQKLRYERFSVSSATVQYECNSPATINDHKRAQHIANTMNYNNFDPNIDALVQAKLLKRQQQASSIILHYTYEQRFSHYKRLIHSIWNDICHNTSLKDTKLIVGTRNNPNLRHELVRKSPYIPKSKKSNQPPII
jgi:hypothetical protein